jgi:hypothetical protein
MPVTAGIDVENWGITLVQMPTLIPNLMQTS